MLRRSSSDVVGDTLGIGVWFSTTHGRGYLAELVISLKMILTGCDSSTAKEATTFFGRSPGTEEFGFFAAKIFLYTWYSSIIGVGSFANCSFSFRSGVNLLGSMGSNSWLIEEK